MSKQPRRKVVISSKKFAAYTMAGAAASLGVSETVDADITYSPVGVLLQDTVPDGANGPALQLPFGDASSYNLNLFHFLANSTSGIALAGVQFVGTSLNQVSIAGSVQIFTTATGMVTYSYASNVISGAAISGLTNWLAASGIGTMAFRGGYGGDQFLGAGEGFLAVRWDDGNGLSYGWIRVDMNGAPENSFTVVDYAFADPGESLMVGEGVIPEPGSLAGLALGATGLAAWRRRRAAA